MATEKSAMINGGVFAIVCAHTRQFSSSLSKWLRRLFALVVFDTVPAWSFFFVRANGFATVGLGYIWFVRVVARDLNA